MLFRIITIMQLCCFYYFLIPFICKGSINLILEGLNPELEYNVRRQFSKIDCNVEYINENFKTELINAVKLGLKPLGYYTPTINIVLDSRCTKNKNVINTLIVKIDPGESIKISNINIYISGNAKNDVDYQKIVKDSQSFIGKKLNHNDYEQLKNTLYNLAIYKGYFDAKFQGNQLIVIPSLHQSIWNIYFNSGTRYFFEDIKFQGNQIKNNYLRNICNISLGEYYDAKAIIELNRRLSATNWFESIFISPDIVTCSQKKKLILNIRVTPNIKNSFEFGSGYTSDIGFRSKIIWKKPWINSYGHSLENNFNLSILEQFIDVSYKIPLFHSPLEQYYLIQGGWAHGNIYNLQSNIVTLNIARYWNFSNYWQRVINLHWYINHCIKKNNLIQITTVLSPGISINRIRKKGTILPYWGSSHRYAMNISTKYWKSDINFIILQLQNIWIQKICEKKRFLIKNNVNWMKTDNLLCTVPFFRFFFIKDRSIRGYEYKCIFPNDYVHYTKLITNTFEYQYNFFDKWWSAFFLDMGEITNKIKWNNFKSGIGVGIRWQLPIGALQLDIAMPLIYKIKMNYKYFHFYINLGPEL